MGTMWEGFNAACMSRPVARSTSSDSISACKRVLGVLTGYGPDRVLTGYARGTDGSLMGTHVVLTGTAVGRGL